MAPSRIAVGRALELVKLKGKVQAGAAHGAQSAPPKHTLSATGAGLKNTTDSLTQKVVATATEQAKRTASFVAVPASSATIVVQATRPGSAPIVVYWSGATATTALPPRDDEWLADYVAAGAGAKTLVEATGLVVKL